MKPRMPTPGTPCFVWRQILVALGGLLASAGSCALSKRTACRPHFHPIMATPPLPALPTAFDCPLVTRPTISFCIGALMVRDPRRCASPAIIFPAPSGIGCPADCGSPGYSSVYSGVYIKHKRNRGGGDLINSFSTVWFPVLCSVYWLPIVCNHLVRVTVGRRRGLTVLWGIGWTRPTTAP